MGDTSLIFSIIARDKTTAALANIQKKAMGVGKTAAFALGPALLPVAAVGTAAVASLGVAMAGAGAAAGVFGAVAKVAMSEVVKQSTQLDTINDKIKLYGTQARLAAAAGHDNTKELKKQAAATAQFQAQLATLPPDTRNATLAFMKMKDGWQGFVDHNKPAVFGVMTQGYKLIGMAIHQLQPFFDMGADAAMRLVQALQRAVRGGMLQHLAATAGPALDVLISIILNVGSALAGTFGKIGAGTGQGILEWIDLMTAKWNDWAHATDRGTGINKFVGYVTANGPKVVSLLGSLATAAVHIAQATSPIAPVSMAIAGALAKMVAAIPPPVLTALVSGFLAFNVAMKAYALGSAIATAAQWALNSALLANPITWIVLAVVALAAGIYLLATKTHFFQNIWNAVWGFLKMVGAWFAGPFTNFFKAGYHYLLVGVNAVKSGIGAAIHGIVWYYTTLWNGAKWAFDKVVAGGVFLVNWFRAAPGKIKNALGSLFSGLWNGFKGYVNRIIGAWNRLQFTIGGGSFLGMSIPSFSIGTPDIPYMATGGRIRRDGLVFAHAGEEITKKAQVTRTGAGTGTAGGGGGATLTIRSDGGRVGRFVLEILREAIRDKGGDPVKVLTPA